MPFPYELYPKAKETHCLNLPEISVSRPPFPGSIRTVDGCFWGERNNNSYVSTHKTDRVCTADGKCYNYNDVFVDEVDPGYSNTCGQTCYVACSCNTSNGWYSSCQGSDCFSVTDTRYAGQPNAASASRSLSDVASISASGANSGISASAAAKSGLKTASAAGNYTATAASAGLKTASAAVATAGATSGISTMAAAATTCYKMKTCSEGGYYASIPADMECTPFTYNDKTCYKDCKKIEYFTIDGKICDADSSQCHSGSITTDQVDNNTMAVFNPTLPYRIKKGETLSNLEAMIPNGIKWEFSHWELQSGSGSFGSTTSALTTFTPNSDVYIIAYVKEAPDCPNGYYSERPILDTTQKQYMEIHEENGCYTARCKDDYPNYLPYLPYYNNEKPLASYGNTSCYKQHTALYLTYCGASVEDTPTYGGYRIYFSLSADVYSNTGKGLPDDITFNISGLSSARACMNEEDISSFETTAFSHKGCIAGCFEAGEIYVPWYDMSACSNKYYKIINLNVDYTSVSGIDIVTDDSCRLYFGGV